MDKGNQRKSRRSHLKDKEMALAEEPELSERRSRRSRDGERRSRRGKRDRGVAYDEDVSYHETSYMAKEGQEVKEDAEEEGPAESQDEGPAESQEGPAESQQESQESGEKPAESSADAPPGSDSSGQAGPESSAEAGPESSALPESTISSFGSSVPGSSSDAYMRKIKLKKGAKSRYMIYVICNMFEEAARELLNYALDNSFEAQQTLKKRQELLEALYYFRHVADVDDDFTLQEYEGEMKRIKVFRQKMGGLAAKEEVKKDSDEDDSTDDGSDGEEDHMTLLKAARKEMQYTFGTPE